MNEDKNEGSENEDCEELEKATQNVHVNVSYCIFISACINSSVPELLNKLKTKVSDQSYKTCLERLKLQILHYIQGSELFAVHVAVIYFQEELPHFET